MRADTINKIFFVILIISVILLLSLAMSNAQLTFYNPFFSPFYYTGSYPSPALYPFPPLYDPFFSAYNSVPVLPFYNTSYFNPVPVIPAPFSTPAITPGPIASVSAESSESP